MTVVAGLLAGAVGAAAFAVSTTAAPRTVALRVVTSEDTSRAIPTEGAVSELTVSHSAGAAGAPALQAVLYATDTFTTRLRPGTYRITYSARPCDGNCLNLDPPVVTCTRAVTLRAGHGVRAGARVVWGQPTTCSISLRRT